MVETKPFKTKLCVLHKRGHCGRETCTFAHGDSELRRYQTSFTDRRLSRDIDLRNKLDRKRSPLHRCSPGRDAKGSRAYKGFSPTELNKRRKLRTHEHMDGPNDLSGRFKNLDGSADSRRDKMHVSINSNKKLQGELKQVQYEVDVLFNQKSHMEIELEERVQEADNLSFRNMDLEAQLSEVNSNSDRVNTKVKKFIRAQAHHSRLQDEMMRSQVQLEQLVGELGINAIPIGASEDKLNANFISDEEIPELKDYASSGKKQIHSSMKATQESKLANMARVHGAKGSWRNLLVHLGGHQEAEVGNKKKYKRPSNDRKPRLQNSNSKHFDPSDELKVTESNFVVPPTSMAAHAVDEFIEVEAEKNSKVLGSPTNIETGLSFLLPPLPSVSHNNYYQYESDERNVDVDGLEEPEEVDIV